MTIPTIEQFVERYSEAVAQGDAALFIGAGTSRPSGFVDWRGLLRELADELGLDIDKEADLVAVAQYHVNTERGRHRLDQAIINEFTKDAQPSRTHEVLARLPIKTIWTTNYDTLIEDAYRAANKRLDTKAVPKSIAVSLPRRDAILYKMHGDVRDPSTAVLTKEDYETYLHTRGAFATTLQADLLNKTFLFLGFSFDDPNLEYVLARIRGLMEESQREHFCIMRAPDPGPGHGEEQAQAEYDQRKFDLRVSDLKRYGIHTVLVNSYDEVPDVLAEVDKNVRTESVFVSGSAAEYGEFGQERLEDLLRQLGGMLVSQRLRIISGLGLGVGGIVVLGAMERLYRDTNDDSVATEDLLAVRPFPIGVADPEERARIWTHHRRSMLSEAGIAIIVAGNRKEGHETVESPGVTEEFDIATELDVTPIPVGATGFAAERLWEQVVAAPTAYFGDLDVADDLSVLGSAQASNQDILAALRRIIEKLRH